MTSDARSHVVQVMLPAYTAFMEHYARRELGHRRDTSNGARVAEALRDFPEHIFEDPAARPSLGAFRMAKDYRESMWIGNRAYEIVCDFSNAWKHRRITRAGRQINSMDDVTESCALVRCRDSAGVFWDARPMVIVRCVDGSEHDLGALVQSSMDAWLLEALRLGIIPRVPALPGLRPPVVSRAEATTDVVMHGQENEKFHAQVVAMEWDAPSGRFTRLPSIGDVTGLLHVTLKIAPAIFDGPLVTRP